MLVYYVQGVYNVRYTRQSDPRDKGVTRMTATHTPGPWSIDDRGDCLDIIGPSGEWLVATVQGGRDEDEPDARLIAAAPELLEAAQLLGGGNVYMEEFGRYCFCPMHGKPGLHSSSCDALNAAIAKAEGGTL